MTAAAADTRDDLLAAATLASAAALVNGDSHGSRRL
jgi:hypothetical protein